MCAAPVYCFALLAVRRRALRCQATPCIPGFACRCWAPPCSAPLRYPGGTLQFSALPVTPLRSGRCSPVPCPPIPCSPVQSGRCFALHCRSVLRIARLAVHAFGLLYDALPGSAGTTLRRFTRTCSTGCTCRFAASLSYALLSWHCTACRCLAGDCVASLALGATASPCVPSACSPILASHCRSPPLRALRCAPGVAVQYRALPGSDLR